jgi:hypothetical protein
MARREYLRQQATNAAALAIHFREEWDRRDRHPPPGGAMAELFTRKMPGRWQRPNTARFDRSEVGRKNFAKPRPRC